MSSKNIEYAFEREVAFLLVDAGRKLNDAYDAKMKPLALTRSQWRVMAYVSRSPGITQTELAASVECSRMAITSVLDRMQSKGLIERREVEDDRRVRSVFLSQKGRSLVRKMNRTATRVLEDVFARVSGDDLRALKETLDVVNANATILTRKNGALQSNT